MHHAVLAARAPVLPHKAGAGGVKRRHHIINDVIHICGGGIAGDHGGVKRIDARLDKQVCHGKDHILDAGRHAERQDPQRLRRMQVKQLPIQAAAVVQTMQMQHDEERREVLRNDARQRHAVRRHPADNDEKEVQDHVEHARDGQIRKRALRVAAGAEHGVAEVEDAERRHPQRVDSEIQHRAVYQIVLRAQQRQHGVREEIAQRRDEHARRRTQQERGVHARAGALVLLRAEILRHAHVDAVGQPDEKARKERDERGR